eukprot:TRINITY_DN12712_c1_g1_i1.p1 TRINITY_DN12712_c1_g1~~TRINITY_DN12712_c1_g1_i1.p1  ORF type:complete len:215 (+),score=28.03 TRINITY_DN12712_c1_g1_i1:1122-1766(+)
MSEKELHDMRGKSDSCPSSTSEWVYSKCEKCSAGKCRVGVVCECASNFLRDTSKQADCLEAVGAVWPDSIGKTDNALIGCTGEETSEANENAEGGASDQKPSSTQPAPAAASSVQPAATETASTVSTTSSSASKETVEEQSGGGLSGLEVSGIIAGIVGTAVAIIALGLEVRKRLSRARNRASSEACSTTTTTTTKELSDIGGVIEGEMLENFA